MLRFLGSPDLKNAQENQYFQSLSPNNYLIITTPKNHHDIVSRVFLENIVSPGPTI